jgi:hypothetical protein
MERASMLFGKHLLASGVPASDPHYGACWSICWRTRRPSSAGQRQELRPARRAGPSSGAVVAGAQPVPGVADLAVDAAQVVGELGGVLVSGQGHGAWRRSYRDPGRAAPVPGDLAS